MSDKQPGPRTVYGLLLRALLTGTIAPSTYVLGAHVIHRIARAKTRQIAATVEDFGDAALVNGIGGAVAGSVAQALSAGDGVRFTPSDVRPTYTRALRELHALGLVFNDIRETALDADGMAARHFTLQANINPGVHWTEKTPIFYRLPQAGVNELARTVSEFVGANNYNGIETAEFFHYAD